MCKLFLICPECFSEQELINEFGEESYFLTSLGAIFDQDNDTHTANIQHLVSTLPIEEVCIFQSTDCNFINQNFNAGEAKIGLPTEKSFASDYRSLVKQSVVSISPLDRKLELAKLNLSRQMAFASQVISDFNNSTTKKRTLIGVIYGEGKKLSDRKIIQKIENKSTHR